jgi:hypothetical protein
MSSYIQTMLCILCMLHSMFHMACGCVAEERIALMHVRSSLVKADSSVPDSWGQSDECCSWERVTCGDKVPRVSGLDLSNMHAPQGNSIAGSECWRLNLTAFSAFRELQLLDLSWNHACLQNLDGMLTSSPCKRLLLFRLLPKQIVHNSRKALLRSSRVD